MAKWGTEKKTKMPDVEDLTRLQNADRLGPYPTKVSVEALESRKFIWTARAFAILFFVSMFLNVTLASIIFTLLPLKRVEPFLISDFDPSDQLIRIEDVPKGIEGISLFTEKMVRNFIKLRQEVYPDREEMMKRLEELRSHSTPDQFKLAQDELNVLIPLSVSSGIVRKVNILEVKEFRNNVYTVDFTLSDYLNPPTPIPDNFRPVKGPDKFRATISYTFEASSVNPAQASESDFINPLGFKIVNFARIKID